MVTRWDGYNTPADDGSWVSYDDYKAVVDKLDTAEKDRDKAQQACAVAYQILGSLSCDFDCFEHPAIQDALTMLADHEETKELLPWDSRSQDEWKAQAATAAEEYRREHQCGRNAACIISRGHDGDCETPI